MNVIERRAGGIRFRAGMIRAAGRGFRGGTRGG